MSLWLNRSIFNLWLNNPSVPSLTLASMSMAGFSLNTRSTRILVRRQYVLIWVSPSWQSWPVSVLIH